MAIREGVWTCTHCDTENRGSAKICASCGDPQSINDGEAPRPKSGASVVADKSLLQQASSGPDWCCGSCGTDNPSLNANCSQCSQSRDGSDKERFVGRYEEPEEEEIVSQINPLSNQADSNSSNPLFSKAIAGVCFFAICFVLLVFWLTRSHPTPVVVVSKSWERGIQVERMITEKGEGFELPEGVRVLSQESRVHHSVSEVIGYEKKKRKATKNVVVGTEKVIVGQKDLGNGFFEDIEENRDIVESQEVLEDYDEPITRVRPVMKSYYFYEQDLWTFHETRTTKGDDSSPYWPSRTVASRERLGKEFQVFRVTFSAVKDKRVIPYPVSSDDEATWRKFEKGQHWSLKIDRLGYIRDVQPAEAIP
jgi:hypothetical protein